MEDATHGVEHSRETKTNCRRWTFLCNSLDYFFCWGKYLSIPISPSLQLKWKLQSKSPRQDHLDHRFDSQDADWEAYGMPNYSKMTGQAPSQWKLELATVGTSH